MAPSLHADDGVWTNLSGGTWSTPGNWGSNTVASGSGFIADFSTLNITTNSTVTLDSSRTIGSLKFGDTSGAQTWTVSSSGGAILTLATDSGAPSITVSNGISSTISAGLQGTQGFTKLGNGTLFLGGGAANTISGSIIVSAGTLGFVTSAASIPANATFEVASGATLNFGQGGTQSNTITLAGGTFGIHNGATFNGDIILTANSTINHNNQSGSVGSSGTTKTITGSGFNLNLSTINSGQPDLIVYSKIQTGSGAVSINGSGTQQVVLAGASNYTGDTTVNTGRLIVNGSITSNVIVKSAARFGGTGSTTQGITVESGGFLTGGNIGGVGTFTADGAIAFNSGSTYSLDFNSSSGSFDKLVGFGFSLGNATLALNDLGSTTMALGQVFTILDGTTSSISGTFSALAEGSVITIGSNNFQISYLADSGRDVTLTTVSTIPEPSTWTMIGGIVSLAIATKRRRPRRATCA